MELKQQQYDAATKHNSGNLYATKGPYSSVLPSKHHATEKVRDVRINVQLNRIRKFKNVAAQSVWYHDLLLELIKLKIERKPLIMYLNGK
jgi:hypothetical protein